MPKKMKITNIRHQKRVTCFNATDQNGQSTYHVIWRTPKNVAVIEALKNGDTLVTDPIARTAQQPQQL